MALTITCPHCGRKIVLDEPYPLPGTERQCQCGRALSITYPMGMMVDLRGRGAKFAAEDEDPPAPAPVSELPPEPAGPVAEGTAAMAGGGLRAREDEGNRTSAMPLGGLRARLGAEEPPPPALTPGALRAKVPPPDPTAAAAKPPPPPPSLKTTLPMEAGGLRGRPPGDEPTVMERGVPRDANERTTQFAGAQLRRAMVDADVAEGALIDEPSVAVRPQRATVPPSKPPPPAGRTKSKKPKRGGWFWKFAAGGFGMTVMGAVAAALAVVGVFWWYGRDLPTLEELAQYRPPTVTVVLDQKGQLLGEIYEKRRYVVPLDRIPKHVQEAFISAEDASFHEHDGVDYMGIVRAILRNAAKGKKAQGASTITQQVARNFLLTSEKTYTRKIKEVLLAWRIEDAFEKDHILYLYLNQIYLGSGAYGVEAAARVYFGKHVEELDVAEAAMIAGLPQRPSDYSPHRHFEKAKGRQEYALGQMVDNGYLTREEADAALAKPLDIVERRNEFLLQAPWFTEHIRRYIVDTYGADKVLNDGLVVESTCDLALQKEAQRAVTEGVTGTDEKTGWRGATETIAEADIPKKLEELGEKLAGVVEDDRYTAVVLDVQKKHAIVGLSPEDRAIIPLAWTEWAYKPDPNRNSKYRKQDDLTRALKRGDVVTVDIRNRHFRDAKPLKDYKDAGEGPFAAADLYQAPEVQGALYSYRLSDGAVLAMVGGVDFKDTQFNRAIQASRQVGSTFKPIVYAAAIESKKFTAGTIVQDAPLIFNSLNSQLWKPENFDEEYLGDITLRHALSMSRNVVTVRVLDVIRLEPVEQMARRLGIESPMEIDLSMGLGSSSLKMPELARAYSAFATNGRLVEPHYVNRVVDRDNRVLEQWTKPAEWKQVLDPPVAGVMNWLLQDIAQTGTAAKAQKLGLHVGGKTGTTNGMHDAWFVGFTPTVLTAVWVGYDQPKSLGASSTGGYTALPIWMDYMADAAPKAEDKPFPMPGSLVWVSIDERSGRPMAGGRSMPFLPGTAPTGVAVEAGQKTTEDLLNSGEF
ncbi:MAG: penicillin-binding protein 1A [Myxococcota bacterium]